MSIDDGRATDKSFASLKVLSTTSGPMPFGSPIDMPMVMLIFIRIFGKVNQIRSDVYWYNRKYGRACQMEKEQTISIFYIRSVLAQELKIDQSLAHDGVCLTVVDIQGDVYTVTAVHETLQKIGIGYVARGTKNQLGACHETW